MTHCVVDAMMETGQLEMIYVLQYNRVGGPKVIQEQVHSQGLRSLGQLHAPWHDDYFLFAWGVIVFANAGTDVEWQNGRASNASQAILISLHQGHDTTGVCWSDASCLVTWKQGRTWDVALAHA